MGRGSTQELLRKIIKSLKESPKSIKEIVSDTNLDRAAVSKYLKILKESKLLIEENRTFTLIPSYRKDTYFGLPLNKESEQKFNSLYFLIRKNWKQLTDKPLLGTHTQKIAYEVIKECKLNIPCGWYIYGGIGVMSYDNSKEYKYYGDLSKETQSVIRETTSKYAKNKYAWQSKELQYQQSKKEIYLLKEEILSIFKGQKFNSKSISDIKSALFILLKKIRRLSSMSPINNSPILNSYQDLMLDFTTKASGKTIINNRIDLIKLFQLIWKYIALFNFQNDLSEYYSKEILKTFFSIEISQQEYEIIELGTTLQMQIPQDQKKKELYEALSKIELSKKTEKKKLEKLKKQIGLKEFNRYLREQAGLN